MCDSILKIKTQISVHKLSNKPILKSTKRLKNHALFNQLCSVWIVHLLLFFMAKQPDWSKKNLKTWDEQFTCLAKSQNYENLNAIS